MSAGALVLGGTPGTGLLDLGGGANVTVPPLWLAATTAGARAQIQTSPIIPAALGARTAAPRCTSTILPIYVARGAARTAPMRAAVTVAWDPNLLSEVCSLRAAGWGSANPARAGAATVIAAAPALHAGAGAGWGPAREAARSGAGAWRLAPPMGSANGRARWRVTAAPRRAGQGAAWRDAPLGTGVTGDAWHQSSLAAQPALAAWITLPLVTAGEVSGWAGARVSVQDVATRWRDGRWLSAPLITRWRDGRLVSYVWRRGDPPGPPPPPPPPSLCLVRVLTDGSLDIGLTCPGDPLAIPRRRSYLVLHHVHVIRLSDLVEIPAAALSLSLDADAWAWSWSGTLLGRAALDKVYNDTGTPIVLQAEIDGAVWHLLCEDWSEDRSFGQRAIKVSGRGLSAELASPYLPTLTGTLQQDCTLQQAMGDRLPLGTPWTIAWWDGGPRRIGGPRRDPAPDWLLPAGCWSWSDQAPISLIHGAAQGVGLVVVPDPAGRTLRVQPRYPVAPWAFWAEDLVPDVEIPDTAILTLARRYAPPGVVNAVYVHGGGTGGVLARILRDGTAGDWPAPTVQQDLVTHIDAARLLGVRELARHWQQPPVRTVTLPLGGDFPLLQIGDLVHLALADGPARGLVSAVQVAVETSANRALTVRQTVTLGEDSGNAYRRWRAILPTAQLFAGRITAVHSDGTVSVALIGGGAQRVRGTGTAGAWVWVRDGVVEGDAPALGDAYEVAV